MTSQTIIKVPYGMNLQLAKEFNAPQPSISAALHGKSKSLRALQIRKRARQILKELNEID